MNEPKEAWLPIVGYEGYYEVSDRGEVRSLSRTIVRSDGATRIKIGMIRRQFTNKKGYKLVTLLKNGEPKTRQVHRLVLEAFVGPCPEGMEACHGPGGPGDNRISNLRWDTQKENRRDIKRMKEAV